MPHAPVLTREEVESFLDREFPQIHYGGKSYHVDEVGPLSARVRMAYHERHIRPGGSLSGPSMMALADLALYVAILAQIGPVVSMTAAKATPTSADEAAKRSSRGSWSQR